MTNEETESTASSSRGAAPVTRLNRGWDRIEGAWDSVSSATRRSRVGRWWKRVERPNFADWALLGMVCVLAFVTFTYADVKVTFQHSFNFLHSVFTGHPGDFYQIALDNSTFGHPAVYDVPIYAVFGIWNLPTYLINHFAPFDYLNSVPALLWLKAMLVAFAVAAALLLVAIAKQLGMSAGRSKWVAFYFLSSMSLFVPILVIVQYDIISVTLMLAGLLAYLKGNSKRFILWFLAANTFKLFALFVFIPLVFLRQKRLPRAFLQVIVGLLGLIVCRLAYRGNLAYEISTGGFTTLYLTRLQVAGFPWHSGLSIPLFVVFMVGLTIFAYAKRTTSKRELDAFALYIPLAAFLVFCALVPLNPYWIALVAPFSILIIFANPRYLTLNTLLEVSISASLFVIYMLVGFSIYNADIAKSLLFGRFVPPASPQRFSTPGELLNAVGLDQSNVTFLIGFMIACVLAVLIVNYPRAAWIAGMPNVEPIKRSVVWVRIAAPMVFCALLFAMYLLPGRPTVFSSVTSAPIPTEVNILNPGSTVRQDMTFDSDLKVNELQVGFDASGVSWINTSAVGLEVTDSSGASVFEKAVPANSIGVGLASFSTSGLVLKGHETYTLTLSTSKPASDSVSEAVYVQINPGQDEFSTTEDGEPVDGDLVLVVIGSPEA